MGKSTEPLKTRQYVTAETLTQEGCPREDLPPSVLFFIGTLSQTLTLRAAFASSTYLLSQIHGPGRSSDDDLLIPLSTHPFQGDDQGLRAFHRHNGFPCPPAPARHLMTCLNPPNPLFKGAHQGLRAFHRRMAALPASSGPASDDALSLSFGRCFFACIVLKKGYQCWAHMMQRVSR